jgi:indole-3-glycerol phosphate synthase
VRDRVAAYAKGGAVGISVLTEPSEFNGTLADLEQAVRVTNLPVMRKDFLVDPYQVFEARAAGAAGVLVILRIVDEARLLELLEAAAEARLFVLLEAFSSADIQRAELAAQLARDLGITTLAGLNARNIATMKIERRREEGLCEQLPRHLPRIAESGIASVSDARRAAKLGYHAALVGTALMQAPDPAALAAAMIAAARMEQQATCPSG